MLMRLDTESNYHVSINRLVEWKVILVSNLSLFDTRNFRFGRFESADRQARIFRQAAG